MDPNKRKRNAPPVPKFEDKSHGDNKNNVNEKVNSFLNEIQIEKEALASFKSADQSQPPLPPLIMDKKKLNMASINNKLNSIMGSKKIDLNKVVEISKKQAQEPERQKSKSRRDIDIEYDPEHPNSYDQAKVYYLQALEQLKLKGNSMKIVNEDEVISHLIEQYEKQDEREVVEIQQQQTHNLEDKESVALRMMQKYGFKVGDGLGKQAQGIKTPLTIKKITDSSCIIEQSSLSLTNFITLQQTLQNALLAFKIQKSKVLVLQLPIPLEQLTEQVQQQIKQECTKHGKVQEWVTFCIDNTIRLYAKFQTINQAFETFLSVNGRYYDEKVIKTFFYNESSFEARRLSENLHHEILF